MGSIQGKMTVDLYANPDPFVQGMKAAENAAKKSGGGIAASIEKINAKQMKNIAGGLLKNLGVIGAIDAGLKIADDMVKGFQDGSIKGFGGAIEALGKTIVQNLESIPIAGALGRLIAAGVDAVSGGTMSQENTQIASRGEAAKNQQNVIEFDRIKKMREAADAEVVNKQIKEKAEKEKEAIDKSNKEYEFFHAKRLTSLEEIKKIETDLRHITMSERDIEIERIKALPQLKNSEKERAIAAYDQLKATEKRIETEKEMAEIKAKTAEDDIKNAIKAREVNDQTIEQSQKDVLDLSKNNMATVDSAIGSIKVAGSQDFSKSTEMALAQKTLTNAIELKKTMDSVDKTLKTMGGVT